MRPAQILTAVVSAAYGRVSGRCLLQLCLRCFRSRLWSVSVVSSASPVLFLVVSPSTSLTASRVSVRVSCVSSSAFLTVSPLVSPVSDLYLRLRPVSPIDGGRLSAVTLVTASVWDPGYPFYLVPAVSLRPVHLRSATDGQRSTRESGTAGPADPVMKFARIGSSRVY